MDLSDIPPITTAMNTTRTTLLMRHRVEQRDHAMPSPITEGDIDPTAALLTGSQLARLSMSGNGSDHDTMDTDESPATETPTTPRKGRARSGAFTEKRKYVVGYREDCEKCRHRVPGHYSHFLPHE